MNASENAAALTPPSMSFGPFLFVQPARRNRAFQRRFFQPNPIPAQVKPARAAINKIATGHA
jgi:hypothetical protein